jgi:hypothetical protein
MKLEIREYNSLKLFRDTPFKLEELMRLSEADDHFGHRRLLIEEFELELHVYFSRMIVFKWLSWTFLLLAMNFFIFHLFSIVFTIVAVICSLASYYNHRKFQSTYRCYSLGLAVLNIVIKREYGILMV